MPIQQRVFISYRRKEPVAAGFVYRFAERMESHFGKGNVFLDANALPYGRDFREALLAELDRADILFVIIGPGWVQRLHELIDEPKDYVRIEVEHMLTSKRAPQVIPILVGGVSMPRSSELPEQVKHLANMQGTSIDTQRLFHETCERLIQDLSKSSTKRGKSRLRLVVVAAVAIVAAGWGYVQFNKPHPIVETKEVKIDKPTDLPPSSSPALSLPAPAPAVIVPPTTRTIPLPNNQSIELIRVEPGRFLMGNPANTDASSDYKPREVELKSEFWISKNEITRSQWAVVMAGATPAAAEAQDPKTSVSYSEIVGPGGFLERLNEIAGDAAWKEDLPTEAQWQYAATRSAEPLTGMTGGAAEWCRDWFQSSSIGMKDVEPSGPSSGIQRVVRGSPDSRSPLYDRSGQAPMLKNPKTGFRIIQKSAEQ